MEVTGKVFKYVDYVDTDVIIPARYLNTSDPKELASHCMEDIDKDFTKKINNGDIIVAKKNFGCGSSREHAPIAIKESGISCVIASTFARIFYRNAINFGLPVITADIDVDEGDILEVNIEDGIIINETTKKTFKIKPFDAEMLDILENGGLVNQYLKNKKEV